MGWTFCHVELEQRIWQNQFECVFFSFWRWMVIFNLKQIFLFFFFYWSALHVLSDTADRESPPDCSAAISKVVSFVQFSVAIDCNILWILWIFFNPIPIHVHLKKTWQYSQFKYIYINRFLILLTRYVLCICVGPQIINYKPD
jgi:hypothetical protein